MENFWSPRVGAFFGDLVVSGVSVTDTLLLTTSLTTSLKSSYLEGAQTA
jgi:hypothetical protein